MPRIYRVISESPVMSGRITHLPPYLIDHNTGAYDSTRITSPYVTYPRRSATSNVVSRVDRAYVASEMSRCGILPVMDERMARKLSDEKYFDAAHVDIIRSRDAKIERIKAESELLFSNI